MQNKTPLKQIFVWLKINLPPSQYCKKINRLIEKIFPQFMFFSIHLDLSSIDNYPTFYFSSHPPPLSSLSFTQHYFLYPPLSVPTSLSIPHHHYFLFPPSFLFKSLSLILTLSSIFGYSHIPGILVSWYPLHSISNPTLTSSFFLSVYLHQDTIHQYQYKDLS